jgi:hypothetical protein
MAMGIEEFLETIIGDEVHITKFGNYSIRGELSLIGSYDTPNIFQQLYYNHPNNQYFLMKKYLSGKVHIDFFKTFTSVPKGLLFGTSGYLEMCVATCEGKELYYEFEKNRYIVSSKKDEQIYRISFGGLKGN